MIRCDICRASFTDEWLLLIHKELKHYSKNEEVQHNDEELEELDETLAKFQSLQKSNETENQEELNQNVIQQETARPSVIRYAPSTSSHVPSLNVNLEAHALPGKTVNHFKIDNAKLKLDEFVNSARGLVVDTLESELRRLNFIKFGLLLDALFTNMQNETSPRGFLTKNRTIMFASDIETIVSECFEELLTKLQEHEGRGSGWSLLEISGLDIRVHKHGYGIRGSSYIPLPKKISNTKSCINVQNQDSECFKYAMLAKYVKDHVERPSQRYKEVQHKYNFLGMSYPVGIKDVSKFEKQNPAASVNVFGLDSTNNVFPLRVTSIERRDHTDLLLITKGDISHYIYIKDFEALVSKQLSKNRGKKTTCKRCFCHIYKPFGRGGKEWLLEHQRLCKGNSEVRIKLPHPSRAYVKFDKIHHQYRIPVVVYADFESSLLPLEHQEDDTAKRSKYQLHKPNSYCLMIKSTLSEDHLQRYGLSSTPKIYRGEEAAQKFVDDLYIIAGKVEEMYRHVTPMTPMTDEEVRRHHSATTCYLCSSAFTLDNVKVRDHDHLTGAYRGAACNSCNLNYKIPSFIPVVLHNLSGYDSHFIIPELGRDDGAIDVLATTMEKFISFSKKIGKIKLRFVDSFRFMPSSLMKLSENLRNEDLIETKKIVPDNKMDLVIRKGVYPYDYIDGLHRFDETSLPSIDKFKSKLNDSEISMEDYQHALRVWTEMDMKTLGEYSDLYVKIDVTLLCDVMEEFRNTCFAAYGLDPLYSYTSPGLAWHAMLKETGCKLQLLTDIDMVLMIESGVRGGLTQSVTRHAKANNKYLPDYDKSKPSTYLGYFDANNLYGWAMSNPLPFDNFKWVDPESIGDITEIPKTGDIGYILDCDFEYPEHLHDHHYDLPLLAKTEVSPTGKYPKLMMTLTDKPRYVAHFWVVQQAIELGLRIKKIHRVLEFSQSCWLKPYIDSNTRRRAAATSSFQKDFFKLMNNAIFGKTLENKRKHKDIKLVTNPRKLEKLVQKPNFGSSVIINENLVAVSMKKISVKMDRPLYIGMSILDISKTHMYDFHYKKMVAFYGRENIKICYMDTDAFIYWIVTNDMYEDLRTFNHKNEFDFSDYPKNHPNYDHDRNKKVIGKFKDEANGVLLQEIVALMSKLYSLKLYESSEIKKAKGVKNLYLKKNVNFEHYKKCLFEDQILTAKFNSIRSFNHQLFSLTEIKKALSCNDDKRHILPDKINTLPFGHYSLRCIDE
jgi:hypothetical protein